MKRDTSPIPGSLDGATLRQIADAISQPAFIIAADGRALHANEAARRIFNGAPRWLASCAAPDRKKKHPAWVRVVPVSGDGLVLVLPDLERIGPDDAEEAPWAARWALPPRLARVTACLVLGLSDKETAERLGLELQTVRTYVKQIYRRVGLHSRAELLRAVRDAQ